MASEKKPLVLANIDNFALEASRRPHMNCWGQHVCVSKISKCASGNIKNPHGKLNSERTELHLTLHTATQSENHDFFFDGQKHQSQQKYIAIRVSNGLWKVHFCNMAQTEPHFGSSKKLIKPVQYCSFAPRGLKMSLSRFENFQHIYKILWNGPRELPWSAHRLRGRPPRVPTSIKISVNELLLRSIMRFSKRIMLLWRWIMLLWSWITLLWRRITIQYSSLHCNTLQYSTAPDRTAQHSTVQHSTLHCSKLQYSTTQYSTAQYTALQYTTVQHNTLHCNTLQYSTLQYSTVHYSTI